MMTNIVFWDTAAFVALKNTRDTLHYRAIRVNEQLVEAKVHVLTTDSVLTEVVNTFSKVPFRSLGWQVVEALQASVALGAATLVSVDKELWERGWEVHRARADKNWGLTDCISFVVMADYGITTAFTHDQHFEQAGFVRLLR